MSRIWNIQCLPDLTVPPGAAGLNADKALLNSQDLYVASIIGIRAAANRRHISIFAETDLLGCF
jgi:hypothetical protein